MADNRSVSLISNDLDLHKRLTGYFDKVTINPEIEIDIMPDILIVSDRAISYNEFYGLYDNKLCGIKHVFYMLSDSASGQNKTIIDVLKAKGVLVIPPKMTPKLIVEKICEKVGLVQNTNKNIAVFIGSDAEVGTTITTQAIAETIAKYSKSKVALLYLNGQPSTEYLKDLKDTICGLDSIKVKVINKILSENELTESFISYDNLYVLPGANNLLDIRYFGNEHIENLIQLTSKLFDIVLIDAGCKVFNGMTIGSINSTHHRYLITTQQENVLKNYERTCNQVFSELDINKRDFFMIINKYVNLPELYTPAMLANTYNTPLIGTLPMLDYGWQAEKEHNTLLNYASVEYNLQLKQLAKIIAKQVGIEFVEEKAHKRGFFSKLFDRG